MLEPNTYIIYFVSTQKISAKAGNKHCFRTCNLDASIGCERHEEYQSTIRIGRRETMDDRSRGLVHRDTVYVSLVAPCVRLRKAVSEKARLR